MKSCILLLLLACCATTTIMAKNTGSLDTIMINQEKLYADLASHALWYQDNSHSLKIQELPGLDFNDSLKDLPKILPDQVQKDMYLKFIITNQADTIIRCYFFPGIYFREIEVYLLNEPGTMIIKIPDFPNEITGFKKMELAPHQTSVFFAKLKFTKTTVHSFTPVLIRDYYLGSYMAMYQKSEKDNNIMTFLFSGILLMMIFYSIAVFLLNRSPEFLYYAGFAFCIGLMLFLKSYLFRTPSAFNNFFEAYLDFMMQSSGTFIYLAFLRKFIETKKNFPWLHTILLLEQSIIIISLILFSFLFFGTDHFSWQNKVENLSKLIWMLGIIIFIFYTIKKKNKLLNYLAAGHSFLLIGGLASLYLINSPTHVQGDNSSIFNNALTYYELGIIAELLFFLTALAFKNKTDIVDRTKERERLKLRTEMQDFEKQLAVLSAQQDERNRISADMHDELGSGVTAIRLMSEIVKAKMKDKVFPEIDKISNAANELIIKMNTIIWTMKSENDSTESLVTYIRIYSLEFFENTSIDCQVKIPPSYLKTIEISGEKRRNIFLSVKETLNNILKHSKAGNVIISFQINKMLLISITDDGVGIDFNKLRQFGSGLHNIKKRMEGIDGTYKIENNSQRGATTTLELKL